MSQPTTPPEMPSEAPETTPEATRLERLTMPNSKNLLVLAACLLLIPFITVTISLIVYNLSGDKYLDRSRPGYMPEQSDTTTDPGSVPSFSDSGPIDRAALDQYLQELDRLTRDIRPDDPFFSEAPLTDDSLGLSLSTPFSDSQNTDN
jgi:hypothetical protein